MTIPRSKTRRKLPLAFLCLACMALASASVAQASVELITNGSIDDGVGNPSGAGWSSSNVSFVSSFDLPSNSNPAVSVHTAPGMAVIDAPNSALNGLLYQGTSSAFTSDANLSFWFQLEARDTSIEPFLLEAILTEKDFLRVSVRDTVTSQEVWSEGLDDWYSRGILGFGTIDPGSTQTGWAQVSTTIPRSILDTLSNVSIELLFATDNENDPLGAQNFVAYIDDVSLQVGSLGPNPAPVPEPSSLLLWSLLGAPAAIGGMRRRRRKAA